MPRPRAPCMATQTPFMLENKEWHGLALQDKIVRRFKVTPNKADEYLQYCMSEFSKSGNIEYYKGLNDKQIQDQCFNKITEYRRHLSPGAHGSSLHVRIPPTINREYKVRSDSDDDLPPPTTHFIKYYT
jgi:hypothetical protein